MLDSHRLAVSLPLGNHLECYIMERNHSSPSVDEETSNTAASRSKSLLLFFLLVFALSIPFWLLGAATGGLAWQANRKQVQAQAEQMNQIMQSVPEGISLLDPKGKILILPRISFRI